MEYKTAFSGWIGTKASEIAENAGKASIMKEDLDGSLQGGSGYNGSPVINLSADENYQPVETEQTVELYHLQDVPAQNKASEVVLDSILGKGTLVRDELISTFSYSR